MAAIVVHELDLMRDGEWSFRDQRPRWRHRTHGSSSLFDPFPAYPHQLLDVEKAAQHVQACCPPLWNVELYIADREEEGRSNGYSNIHEGGHYEGDQWVKDEPTGLIMLSGKRIPPHPAVTRYLVAHEYGHNVEWMLQRVQYPDRSIRGEDLIRAYAQVRGLPEDTLHHGYGGRWHDSATEIFACDFRILVCNVEPGFWPHPGITHPQQVGDSSTLNGWWADAVAQLAERRAARDDTQPVTK